MAKSKHRKAHKKALASYRDIQALAAHIAAQGQPHGTAAASEPRMIQRRRRSARRFSCSALANSPGGRASVTTPGRPAAA